MTTLAYTVPVPGSDLNSVADPEIASALTTIKAWANGNIDTGNLAVGTVGGIFAWNYRPVGLVNSTAASGDFMVASGGTTITLPAAAAGATVTVQADSTVTGAFPLAVVRSGGAGIYGLGLTGVTAFVLGAPFATVILVADGTSWRMIAGARDTGWVPPLLINAWTNASGGVTPAAYRVVGDWVELRGAVVGGTSTIFQLPAGARPTTTIQFVGAGNAPIVFPSGNVQTFGSGSCMLDGFRFSVL